MRQIVVDASVAVKWLIPESCSSKAMEILESDRRLLAPDLIWTEIGNMLDLVFSKAQKIKKAS